MQKKKEKKDAGYLATRLLTEIIQLDLCPEKRLLSKDINFAAALTE